MVAWSSATDRPAGRCGGGLPDRCGLGQAGGRAGDRCSVRPEIGRQSRGAVRAWLGRPAACGRQRRVDRDCGG
eukprot:13404596-Alexandrium_andersonii.AAC.1